MLMVMAGIMLIIVIRFTGWIINLLLTRSSNWLPATEKTQSALMIVSVSNFRCLSQTFTTARMTVKTIQKIKIQLMANKAN